MIVDQPESAPSSPQGSCDRSRPHVGDVERNDGTRHEPRHDMSSLSRRSSLLDAEFVQTSPCAECATSIADHAAVCLKPLDASSDSSDSRTGRLRCRSMATSRCLTRSSTNASCADASELADIASPADSSESASSMRLRTVINTPAPSARYSRCRCSSCRRAPAGSRSRPSASRGRSRRACASSS